MRLRFPHPWLLLDLIAASFVAVLIEVDVWRRSGVLGTHIAGPRWLTVALPLLLALPLFWRRRFPLLVWAVALGGVVGQAVSSGDAFEGLYLLVPFGLGSYAVGAYGSRRRALIALALFVPVYVTYALEDHNIRTGGQQAWSGAFFGLLVVAVWLAGVFVSSRREAALLVANAAELKRRADAAVAEERSRIARELHDIISHTVSVIGLQAGAAERMLDRDPERARQPLQSIQERARDSVLELRRLFGILREGDEGRAELTPQPRLAQLGLLLEQVRGAGLEVALRVEGEPKPLPPGVELSAYRIVQEALTNVLKHARASRADVLLRYGDRLLELAVTDDGIGALANGSGHGLIGMRERAALYGGTLTAGRQPSGGFAVAAQLPHGGAAS
ncbi:MAG TPA: sensor histidine kinase [Dehalococcoidia bacterium]|nr:sensor histidine kinase [Dehalococcoidia bacterium]